MTDTVLFDLDGTLLPMDQGEFIKAYFSALLRRVVPLGYGKDAFIAALWKGTGAMVANSGEKTNRERFWEVFASEPDMGGGELESILEDFYKTDFNAARTVVRDAAGRDLRPVLASLRERGYGVILATNPIFPAAAVASRLKWIGLGPDDFDMVTTYENCSYCKPNPAYYTELIRKAGRRAKNCLMIGNNVKDDMAAAEAGAEVFLVTDFLENEENADISSFIRGDFSDMCRLLAALPPVG